MNRTVTAVPPTDWGRIHIAADPGVPESIDGPPIRAVRHTWHPPADVGGDLPAGFALRFDALGRSRGRRFVPELLLPAFVLCAAAAGGAALLTRDADPQYRFTYRATRLVYQKAAGLREHLARTFARESDLSVGHAGRDAGVGGHLLPPDLGLDAAGRGTAWTPRQVIARGRGAAVAAGVANPDEAACVRHGLTAAARLNPLDPTSLSEEQGRALVRLALFDLGPTDGPIADDVLDAVQGRLWAAVERHADDDTDAFAGWFVAGNDNLVHAIAKQKKGGGPFPREAVWAALLELVFRAYGYVGDCVHAQMTSFARALTRSADRRRAGRVRGRSPSATALRRVADGPPPRPVRLLARSPGRFVGGAGRPGPRRGRPSPPVVLRRDGRAAAGRRPPGQGPGAARNLTGRPVRVVSGDLDQETDPRPGPDRFTTVVAAVMAARGPGCRCSSADAWNVRLGSPDPAADPVTVDIGCHDCGFEETVAVTRAELRSTAGGDGPGTDGDGRNGAGTA
jgi:hypothetical protein